ncbi:hypothetical protein ACS0TY_034689 [Phlomoides rotata]
MEKYGGNPKSKSQMNDFRNSTTDLGLFYLGSLGPKFSWKNRRHGSDLIHEKLDRFFANHDWRSFFQEVEVHNFIFYESDHRPVLLRSIEGCSSRPTSISKTFKFEYKWLVEDSFSSILSKVWSDSGHINSLPARLRCVSDELSNWASESVNGIEKMVWETR